MRRLGPLLLALSGATATFVLTTVLMDQVPDTLLVAAALVGAFAFVAASQGDLALAASEVKTAPEVWRVVGDGILVFWAAPLFALSQRATDSPSGSDAAMLTTAAWGALTILTAFVLMRRGKGPYLVLAGALCVLVGAMAILANWERPSSLNLFVKAADREAMILVAGLVFAIGAVRLMEGIRALGARRAALASVGGATVVASLVAAPTVVSSLPAMGRIGLMLSLLAVAYGAFCIGWIRACASGGPERAALALLLVPSALTGLSLVERIVGVFGPNPLVWPGLIAGLVLSAGGAAAALFSLDAPGSRSVAAPVPRWAWAVGTAAVTLAIAALLLPAIRATSEGTLGVGFKATWNMLGFETAGGWWPLVASTLALAALLDLSRGRAKKASVAGAIASLISVFTVSLSLDSPLHTWTSWIPPDVQQTYGTEYARLTTEPLVNPISIASLGLAVLTAVVALVLAYRTPAASPGEDAWKEGS